MTNMKCSKESVKNIPPPLLSNINNKEKMIPLKCSNSSIHHFRLFMSQDYTKISRIVFPI